MNNNGKSRSRGAKFGCPNENMEDKKKVFGIHIETEVKDLKGIKVIKSLVDRITNNLSDLYEPKKGVISFFCSKSTTRKFDGEGEQLYFHQMFSDAEAYLGHLSELELDEVNAAFLCKEISIAKKCIVVNAPTYHDGIMACFFGGGGMMGGSSAQLETPIIGAVFNPIAFNNKFVTKYQDEMRPKRNNVFLIEMRFEAKPDDIDGTRLLNSLKPLVEVNIDNITRISSFLIKDKKTKSFIVYIIDFMPNSFSNNVLTRSRTSEILNESISNSIIYTASDLTNEDHISCIDHFVNAGLNVIDQREVLSGYIVHPFFASGWEGKRQENEDKNENENENENDNEKRSTSTPISSPTPNLPFKYRKHAVTGIPETIIFDKDVIDKSKGNMTDEHHIPILCVVRHLTRAGRIDTEFQVATVFGQLARLRNLLFDAELINSASDDDIENNVILNDSYHRLIQIIAILGYGMPIENRIPILFDNMKDFISSLEDEFCDIIRNARSAILENGQLEYMGLQELYPIGSTVLTNVVGGLGGTTTAFRIVDCHYEPYRSLFGTRKYSFKFSLETIVALGGEFVAVPFEIILPEWVGGCQLQALDYLPLKVINDSAAPANSLVFKDVVARGKLLSSLAGRPSYRRYRAGSFFPHRSGRGTNSSGVTGDAESTMHRVTFSGRLIVDSSLGLQLGFSPTSSYDEVSLAISATMRTYRTAERNSNKKTESETQRQERLRTLGLRVYPTLDPVLCCFGWPTIVAFSLTIKQWGVVLVDGLEIIVPSGLPWSQLVLPAETKEILRVTASSSLRSTIGEGNIQNVAYINNDEDEDEEKETDEDVKEAIALLTKKPRYKCHDIVDSKGSGTLFLLYGPPGTGKTLSVEALATLFGRPLYAISFAELGSTVSELEAKLTQVMSLAAHWGALVLLDEGDALVERRQRGQLILNSMGAILLRLLEGFEGALFITSNRASSFDPAALSRVTLAIKYDLLDVDGKRSVWKNTLVRVLAIEEVSSDNGTNGKQRGTKAATELVEKIFDLSKLSVFSGSGRAVNAIVRLAIGLTEGRNCDLNQKVLEDAIGVWNAFNQDLSQENEDNYDEVCPSKVDDDGDGDGDGDDKKDLIKTKNGQKRVVKRKIKKKEKSKQKMDSPSPSSYASYAFPSFIKRK